MFSPYKYDDIKLTHLRKYILIDTYLQTSHNDFLLTFNFWSQYDTESNYHKKNEKQ